jgi:hypothetical protein
MIWLINKGLAILLVFKFLRIFKYASEFKIFIIESLNLSKTFNLDHELIF